MTDRLLVDLGADGRVAVSTWPDGELPNLVGEPFELVWPLDADALEDLRWYLEDYLRAPFGVYGERGPRVAAQLTDWGRAVFAAIFGAGSARDAYVQVRARAVSAIEIVFRSSSPTLLGLPWELLCDPARPTPVALDRVGVSRSLPTAALANAFIVRGKRLRVLMVISRPKGAADVGYQMIARPLLKRLEAVRGRVELVVLRPPTLDRLAEVLSNARAADEPFQVVHFDGHGVLDGQIGAGGSGAPLTFEVSSEQGALVFEKPSGGPDHVPAADVARVLAAAQVPVVVINACQSGAVGKQLEAAVATRLLQEGAASVVAMAYSVYAVAAAEFMAAFYESLFAGDRVSDAVSAGRRRLARRAERPSLLGKMPLQDWVVPVHYMRREVRFPNLQAGPVSGLSLDEMLDRLRQHSVEDPGSALAPGDSFVGRDGLFFCLEVATRHQRVVVLHGPAGTGKTELAKAFGRWWRDTGGVERSDWVIWQSFKPGVASFGLDGVVGEIGLRVFGADFIRLEPVERRRLVLQLLVQRRLLLIWDNFEAVHTLPDPARTPPLDVAELDKLRGFLQQVAAEGTSAVLVTSRTEETWLGALRRVSVGGLTTEEAIEYADQVLAPYPGANSRRTSRAFADLMEWLDGHPMSMRVVLPYLYTTGPDRLLSGLRGIAAPLGLDVLGASIVYSVDHLSTNVRRLLVVVSLFEGIADAQVLDMFSRVPEVPHRFSECTKKDWTVVLDQAAAVGLLSPLGVGMYGIHPALPAYLANQWRIEESEHYEKHRAAAQAALLVAHAALGDWLFQHIQSGDAAVAFRVIDQQRRTLGSFLGLALDRGLWDYAQVIAQPLDVYWRVRGLNEEARAWTDRARLALEAADGTPPALDDSAGSLWLLFMGSEAARQVEAHQLNAAERTYLQAHEMLQQQSESYTRSERLAVNYLQLGRIAMERGHLDEAEGWCLKSLALAEELGDSPHMSVNYQHLGVVAQEQGRLDDAEDWNLKSLTILQELGDRPSLAISYHQLGRIAELRQRLNEAEKWYLKSLAIHKELGNRPDMAVSYHQLGIVAEVRGRLNGAVEWYLKSLTIAEEFGNRPRISVGYFQLGMVAHRAGRLEDAEDWYRKSLTIGEELNDRPHVAACYHQLGMLARHRERFDEAEEWYRKSLADEGRAGNRRGMAASLGEMGLLAETRGQLEDALEWTIRCLALFEEFPHPLTGPAPRHLVRITAELGIDALERCWHRVTGQPLPASVRDFVRS